MNNNKANIERLEKILTVDYKKPYLSEACRKAIEATLETGNYTAAGRALGVHMTTVRNHCLNALKGRGYPKGGGLPSLPLKSGGKAYRSQRVAKTTSAEAIAKGITIESGIPLPSKMFMSSPITSTLRNMKVGDSFTLDKSPDKTRIYRGIHSTANRIGVKVAVRDLGDGTFRVWKTA